MPYKSKAQMRLFFAKEKAGEMPKGTALRWAHETKNRKKLPEHVKKAFFWKKKTETTSSSTPSSDDIHPWTRHAVAQLYGVHPSSVTKKTHFSKDLGADELDHLDTIHTLESHTGGHVSDREAKKLKTVGHLDSLYRKHTKSNPALQKAHETHAVVRFKDGSMGWAPYPSMVKKAFLDGSEKPGTNLYAVRAAGKCIDKKAFWEGFEKEAARRRQTAHGKPHLIPKDPFKQIQRRMVRRSRTYYT